MSDKPAPTNPVDLLVPFTGFYALEDRPGAFVSIDANLIYLPGPGGKPVMTNQASVSICIDGQTVDEFAFSPCCTFDGKILTVTNAGKPVAHLRVFKNYSDGNSSAMIGTIGGHTVHGTTPFSPIHLPVFAGEYYLKNKDGSYTPQLTIKPDYSVAYNDGSGLVPVPAYVYNYSMFVVEFPPPTPKAPAKVTLEMGTTSASGKVAGNMANGTLLVTMRKTNVYPPPKP
jgi:hypothetical protein